MARVTVEDCIDKVDNRFELVLLASHRARLISAGAPLTIDRDRDKNPVVALREIAEETITPDDLKEQLIHSLQKYVEVDEPEAETVPLLVRTAAAPRPSAASGDDTDVQFDRMSEEDLLRGLEVSCPRPSSDEDDDGSRAIPSLCGLDDRVPHGRERRRRRRGREWSRRKARSPTGLFYCRASGRTADSLAIQAAAPISFSHQHDEHGHERRAAAHDAPVRICRAGQALQSRGRRGASQPGLCLRHDGARHRRSAPPAICYFGHPLEVAAILTDLKLDDATIAAAVLHDTVEDTAATLEEINKIFGPEIGTLVDGLTKLKRLDLVSKRAAQGENFRKLLLAIADDVRVLLVKLADRLHNMRTLHFMPPDKRKRIAEETLEIYAPLAGRMGIQEMREELEDLAFRHPRPGSLRDHQPAPRRSVGAQRATRRGDRAGPRPASSRRKASGARHGAPEAALLHLAARWSANRSPSSSYPTLSVFA